MMLGFPHAIPCRSPLYKRGRPYLICMDFSVCQMVVTGKTRRGNEQPKRRERVWLRVLIRRSLMAILTVFVSLFAISESAPYRYALEFGKDGKPRVEVWNDSEQPITGLAVTVDLRDAVPQVESRTYYDIYINPNRDFPIDPHQSREIPTWSVVGSPASQLVPVVRAVIFGDGSAVGEQVWIDALLRRRHHLYGALMRLHAFLAQEPGSMAPHALAELVQAAEADMHKDVPDDEFRSQVDDLVFESAVGTFQAARSSESTRALKLYMQQLESRIEQVAGSKPDVTSVPNTPAVVPPPFKGSHSSGGNGHLTSPGGQTAGSTLDLRFARQNGSRADLN